MLWLDIIAGLKKHDKADKDAEIAQIVKENVRTPQDFYHKPSSDRSNRNCNSQKTRDSETHSRSHSRKLGSKSNEAWHYDYRRPHHQHSSPGCYRKSSRY